MNYKYEIGQEFFVTENPIKSIKLLDTFVSEYSKGPLYTIEITDPRYPLANPTYNFHTSEWFLKTHCTPLTPLTKVLFL